MLQPRLGYVKNEVIQRRLSPMPNDYIKKASTRHLVCITYTFVRNSINNVECYDM